MNIEEGKYYETRDGRFVGPMEFRKDAINGLYCWYAKNGASVYTKTGLAFENEETELDLVCEWDFTPHEGDVIWVRMAYAPEAMAGYRYFRPIDKDGSNTSEVREAIKHFEPRRSPTEAARRVKYEDDILAEADRIRAKRDGGASLYRRTQLVFDTNAGRILVTREPSP